MKKILFWAALSLAAVVSCNKELENETPAVQDGGLMSFVATVDGADTKTVLDGVKNYWNGTEQIRVFDGSVSKVFEAKDVAKAQKATFTEVPSEDVLAEGDYLAIYPAAPAGSASWDGNVENPLKNLWLPADQTATEGSYDPFTHVAVAYAEPEASEFAFRNVLSVFKFTAGSDGITEVSIGGNSSEKICGNFDVTYNGGNPAVNVPEAYYNLNYAKVTGELIKGKTYYISIFPATFANGIYLSVNNNKTLSSTQKFVASRNVIYDLGTVELPDMASHSWSIVGLGGDWNTDIDMVLEGGWFVARNLTIKKTDEFKLRADKGWDISVGGGETPFASGVEYAAGSGNAKVAEDGIYDVYLSKDGSKIKVEKVGDLEVVYPSTIYFRPNSNWTEAGAKFEAWTWGGTSDGWAEISEADENGVYTVTVPNGNTSIKFLRTSPTEFDRGQWNGIWNRAKNQNIPTDGRILFSINDGQWGSSDDSNGAEGTWSTLE